MTVTARAGRHAGTHLAGTLAVVRLMLRRDRIRIPSWILGITAFTVASTASFTETYPTAESRQAVAATLELPAMVAMVGPNYAGVQDYTYGAMTSHQMTTLTAVVFGLMSVLLFVRHTRAEEEAGRTELLRAGVVGRHAPLTAAVLVVAATNLLLAATLAGSLATSGPASVTWTGSWLFGASLAGVGLVFTGVAAVTSQLTPHARAASGSAMVVLGAAYALRAAGDVVGGPLSWLSPIGWAQQTRAYVDDRWWPLLLALGLSAALITAAFVLGDRRDVGAGLREPRPGPARASALLVHPLGLALRLHRGALIGWSVALFLLGVMYGSILGNVGDLMGELSALEDMLPDITGAGLTEAYASMITTVLAMISSVYVVLAVLRLRAEESAGRAEPLLSTAVSRARWAAGHLVVALVGGVVVVLAAGLGVGIAGAIAIGEPALVGRMTGAALAYVPALWVTGGVALALFGLLPRAAQAAWTVVAYAFVVVYLGGFLQLPEWLRSLSPFGHVPQLPAAELTAVPLAVLTALAAALVAGGLVGLRHRDLRAPT